MKKRVNIPLIVIVAIAILAIALLGRAYAQSYNRTIFPVENRKYFISPLDDISTPDSCDIVNNTIEIVDINMLNTPADGDVITYETDSGGGFWAVPIAKDIVAGVGLSGGENDVLVGEDADTTLTFASTELTALTWSNNGSATIPWSFNVSGTDHTMTAGSAMMTFSHGVTASTLSLTNALTVPYGGTGATSFTDGGILLGSGTSAITALGVASNGQIPIGDGSTGPQLGTLTATTNETTITNAAASITVGLVDHVVIQDINLTDFSGGTESIAEILDDTLHADVLDAIVVTDAGTVTITWTAGEIWDACNVAIVETDANATPHTCTDDAINYLYWDRSGGGTALTVSTTVPDDVDHDVIVATINCADGDIWELNHKPIYSHEIPALIRAFRDIFPSIVSSGLVVSEHTSNEDFDVDMTEGVYYVAAYGREAVTAQDSNADGLVQWWKSGASSWTAVSGYYDVNTAYWNSGTSLATVTGARYYRSLFFVTNGGINWVYPTAEYVTVAQAIAGPDPALPAGLTDHPKSTVVIIQGNDTNLPTAGGTQWIDRRPIIGGDISGVVSDHGNLAGLAGGDDHSLGTGDNVTFAQVTVTGDFLASIGSESTPSYTVATDLDTGMWFSDADKINFSVNHDEVLELDAAEATFDLPIAADQVITGDITATGGTVYFTNTTIVDVNTIASGQEILIKPKGDDDDFLSFSTASDVPQIYASGNCNLKLIASSGTIDFDDEHRTGSGTVTWSGGGSANANTAYTHANGSTGADHTYLNQSVVSGATPTFGADNFSDGGGNAIVTTTQETNWDNHLVDNGADHTFIDQAVTVAGTPTFDQLGVGTAPTAAAGLKVAFSADDQVTTMGISCTAVSADKTAPIIALQGLGFTAYYTPVDPTGPVAIGTVAGSTGAVGVYTDNNEDQIITATNAYGFASKIGSTIIGAGGGDAIVTNGHGFHAYDGVAATGTITNLYGFYDDGQTVGATNWGIGINTAANYINGSLRIGSAVAPGEELDVTGDVLISGHIGLGADGVIVNDYGLYYAELLTDTDNSVKAGAFFGGQVTKTSAAMTSYGTGFAGNVALDSTNTQNWTNSIGLRGIYGLVSTEGGSTGTISGIAGLVTGGIVADAATVNNLYGLNVYAPAVAGGKLVNNYGIYLEDQAAAGSGVNYAIYTAGAASDTYLEGSISALDVTDRTPAWLGTSAEALSAVMAIRAKDGKVDHESLPESCQRTVTELKPTGEFYPDGKEICEGTEISGRSLSAMVSLLVESTKALQAENEALKARVAELEEGK